MLCNACFLFFVRRGGTSSSTRAKPSSCAVSWVLRVRTAAPWRPGTWIFSKFLAPVSQWPCVQSLNIIHISYRNGLVWTRILVLFLSYIIAQGVCYLVLCEASFPKKMAFGYLEDLHAEFYDQYARRVPTVTRPYSFIEFGKCSDTTKKQFLQSSLTYSWYRAYIVPDTYIQKTKKAYVDSRARRNLGSINTELQDVQRIMVANIEEVLQRGEALSGKVSNATDDVLSVNVLDCIWCCTYY